MLEGHVRKRDRPHSAGLGRGKRNGAGSLVTAALAVLLLWSFLTNLQV